MIFDVETFHGENLALPKPVFVLIIQLLGGVKPISHRRLLEFVLLFHFALFPRDQSHQYRTSVL